MKGTTLPGQVGSGPVLQQQTEHKPQHLLYSYNQGYHISSTKSSQTYQGKNKTPQSKFSRKKGRSLLDKPTAPTCSAAL